ncbi:PREDICTED: probable galacturonosyltransferase 6 isoform X1 [Tarenaya hassleriana]|uniref:probable galacturonosyltransferase 6 isoform X1 n=1 Tax=Tarenaya hassleriana TaxID=28532 RepID=UPI00053C226A|nr:PREDICTED: probable galacturonosyltransferase 6 isoform X1 [Tarenaya hassleriana]
MRQVRRWQGILILSLLSLSVLAPIVFVSNRLKSITSVGRREFIEELSNIRYSRTNDLRLNAIEQEDGGGLVELKGPKLILFKDEEFNSLVQYSSSDESGDAKLSNEDRKTGAFAEIGDGYHRFSFVLFCRH